jgi:hypothetical protein
VSDAEQEPSRQPPGTSRQIRTDVIEALVLIFFVATLVLWLVVSDELLWHIRGLQMIVLIGMCASAIFLALRDSWLRHHDQPGLIERCDRKWKWILGTWGFILAAVVFWLVLRDQAHTRNGAGFRSAMDRIEVSSELADRLGRPIRAGWWIGGEEPVAKFGTFYSLSFTVSGPKGSARVSARTTWFPPYKAEPVPSESVLVIIDGTGERIELVKPRSVREGR